MQKINPLTICLIITNVGLVLSLLGFSLIIFNQPVIEGEEIQNASSNSIDPNSERTVLITNVEIQQTRTNDIRAQNRQYGKIIVIPAVILFISGIISFFIVKQRQGINRELSPADMP
ncbi:hypothetical protein ACFLZ8_05945 [Planctomycetota bacterium]